MEGLTGALLLVVGLVLAVRSALAHDSRQRRLRALSDQRPLDTARKVQTFCLVGFLGLLLAPVPRPILGLAFAALVASALHFEALQRRSLAQLDPAERALLAAGQRRQTLGCLGSAMLLLAWLASRA